MYEGLDIRDHVKGQYDTDLSNIKEGLYFPSLEVRSRNIQYKNNKRLYTGDYTKGKRLIAMVDGQKKELEYKILNINYFKLIVNKLDSLLFSNELNITTGDLERDKIVKRLVDKTSWINSIRQGIRLCQIYGDCILKTYRYGVSVTSPRFGYKVVDKTNKKEASCYVLREILYQENRTLDGNIDIKPTHIRILISGKGFDFEQVYEYTGSSNVGRLGRPVRFKYKDRWIPKSGRYYFTNIDEATVQWLSVNTESDGVYGEPCFNNVKDIVFALEKRLSMDNFILDAHGLPILLVGQSMVKTDETTGDYYISLIRDQFMIDKGSGEVKPSYLTWDGKLDNSEAVKDTLRSYLYELSEMGRTFLSGEFSGNISEETLGNIIKGAIDRGHREINSLYKQIRASLYVLCRLNDIYINIEDINIEFNIGRADDIQVLSKVSETLKSAGLFSSETLLCKFWGYNEADASAEMVRIKKEGEISHDNEGAGQEVIRDG